MSRYISPILDFSNGRTLGWEALSRGPEGSSFYRPSSIFNFAEHIGAVYELDQRCREMAIKNLGFMEEDQLLFINTHQMSLNNNLFFSRIHHGITAGTRSQAGKHRAGISEKQNLNDPCLLRMALTPYTDLGFKVAIDDVGSGHFSLRLLSQIRPDYIKIDSSLVRKVDSDPYKRMMVEILVYLAKKMDSRVIALGLESENEFSSLVSMGVRAGQGFLLSGPEAEKKEITVTLPTGASWQETRDLVGKCSKPVKEMVEIPMTVTLDATVEAVKELMDKKAA